MNDHSHAKLTIEAAAADADVDVETYRAALRDCEHASGGKPPERIGRELHGRVMLSLSLPPPPL